MARRRQARRPEHATPAWLWFAGGLVCGLGLATMAWVGGYLPQATQMPPEAEVSGRDEAPIAELDEDAPPRRQYDFFTVLPEVEVVVPAAEIEQRAREEEATEPPVAQDQQPPATEGAYILQVGSFRSENDAESVKAQLALLGLGASIQQVTINGDSWYRVRVGPFSNARDTDDAQRRLRDNGFDTLVISGGG